ncbi:MAG: hypothetical protein AB1668_02315 [Nanoarchaeota archaeon]
METLEYKCVKSDEIGTNIKKVLDKYDYWKREYSPSDYIISSCTSCSGCHGDGSCGGDGD